MENKDYKEMIETAKKAVEGLNLDESMKMKAFEKVLDDLLGKNKSESTSVIATHNKKRKTIANKTIKNNEKEEQLEILNKLKAEDFARIHNLKKSLDWSLYILQVLRDKYSVDGLIPSEIAAILSEKFRIKTNQFVIGMALMNAKEYVDRHKTTTRGGMAYKYRIMKKGEDYIKQKIEESDNRSGHSNKPNTNSNSS
ncbi:hypothetical protein COU54_00935 [Candidatus Pacearchaeota archaeon CG10_big_fil_rev_8_21_14_0_10_31_24]|nr:MAG: hypothetical protein COU54_00935 [Candidatus Pacearchaeota archaeon CG10_big_fil_rev_8_21_14_0_10_31_24]